MHRFSFCRVTSTMFEVVRIKLYEGIGGRARSSAEWVARVGFFVSLFRSCQCCVRFDDIQERFLAWWIPDT